MFVQNDVEHTAKRT